MSGYQGKFQNGGKRKPDGNLDQSPDEAWESEIDGAPDWTDLEFEDIPAEERLDAELEEQTSWDELLGHSSSQTDQVQPDSYQVSASQPARGERRLSVQEQNLPRQEVAPAVPVRHTRESAKGADPLRKVRRNQFWLLAFQWLVLVYAEIVLRSCTISSRFWSSGLLFILLFSIAPALLVFIVTTNFKPKANYAITVVYTIAVFVLYASQLVYYKVFSMFYSTTSMGRAGQVMEFWKIILQTIGKNAVPLLLLLLPMLFVSIFGKRFFSFKGGAAWQSSLFLAALMVVVQLVSVWSLPIFGKDTMSPYDLYHKTNDLQESVVKLGMGTAFQVDLKRLWFGGGSDGSLVLSSKPTLPPATSNPDATDSPVSTADTTTPTDPNGGLNVLNLDFDALISGEGNADIREMHEYFAGLTPTNKNEKTGMFKGDNLILITAEGFSYLSIDPERTPTLYKLQTEGFYFKNFYTPIWGVSTSDGEYVAMTGTIPKSGVWSFYRSSDNYMPLVMSMQLKNQGYSAYAYHDHTYDYYDRDLSHPNLGYIYKAVGNGLEIQNTWPESDIEMIDKTTAEYMGKEPFHTYYMTVSGHMNYTFSGNYIAGKNKDLVEDEPYSDNVKAYLACQIELDRALELLLERLEEAGVADRTVIALTADHYPYGLTVAEQSELAGHDLEENFELYRNACFIYKKGMTPETVERPCSSLDLLPTLSNLFGLEFDSRLYMGQDVFSDASPLIVFSNRSWITDQATYNSQTGEVVSLTGQEIPDDYVSEIKNAVNNKFTISARILDNDYWRVLFKKEEESG